MLFFFIHWQKCYQFCFLRILTNFFLNLNRKCVPFQSEVFYFSVFMLFERDLSFFFKSVYSVLFKFFLFLNMYLGTAFIESHRDKLYGMKFDVCFRFRYAATWYLVQSHTVSLALLTAHWGETAKYGRRCSCVYLCVLEGVMWLVTSTAWW